MEPDDMSLTEEEDDAEMEEAIKNCITMLLGVFYARMEEDDENDAERDLGEIRIIMDPSGEIGERVTQIGGGSRKYTTYFACAQTESDAYKLEYQLTRWAVSPERVAIVIRSLQPEYERADFVDEFNEVIEKVTDVLFKATVIPLGSPLHILLNKGAKQYC